MLVELHHKLPMGRSEIWDLVGLRRFCRCWSLRSRRIWKTFEEEKGQEVFGPAVSEHGRCCQAYKAWWAISEFGQLQINLGHDANICRQQILIDLICIHVDWYKTLVITMQMNVINRVGHGCITSRQYNKSRERSKMCSRTKVSLFTRRVNEGCVLG